jgi:hypothetical protein
MRGVGEAKMPGNVPLPLYGQRGCAAVIAGLGWFGIGVQLYFNVQDALVKDLPVAGHLIDYFSFFTIETNLLVALVLTIFCARPQAGQFLGMFTLTKHPQDVDRAGQAGASDTIKVSRQVFIMEATAELASSVDLPESLTRLTQSRASYIAASIFERVQRVVCEDSLLKE